MIHRQPVQITRKASFCAAHRYWRPEWSEEKNREIFGPCSHPHGHGHNYVLEVTLSGAIDPETGMVINLKEVDSIVHEEVISVFDHRNINEDVPGFDRIVPTSENIALYIWAKLEKAFNGISARLHGIRLHENPELYVEILAGDRDP